VALPEANSQLFISMFMVHECHEPSPRWTVAGPPRPRVPCDPPPPLTPSTTTQVKTCEAPLQPEDPAGVTRVGGSLGDQCAGVEAQHGDQ
jgi:hypothetical protein